MFCLCGNYVNLCACVRVYVKGCCGGWLKGCVGVFVFGAGLRRVLTGLEKTKNLKH